MSVTVCYFIQSHRDPEQIYRLVRTLHRGSPTAVVVVQHNPAGCALDFAPIADLPRVHSFQATPPQLRSDFSCQMQPYFDAVDWLERFRALWEARLDRMSAYLDTLQEPKE